VRKLTIIRPDSTVTVEIVKKAELAHLQSLVGGLIQCVPHFVKYDGRRCQAWCNDEGRLLNLPRNDIASKLWSDQVKPYGDVWYEPEVFGTLVIEQVHKG
jgi:hypothetical protein